MIHYSTQASTKIDATPQEWREEVKGFVTTLLDSALGLKM